MLGREHAVFDDRTRGFHFRGTVDDRCVSATAVTCRKGQLVVQAPLPAKSRSPRKVY